MAMPTVAMQARATGPDISFSARPALTARTGAAKGKVETRLTFEPRPYSASHHLHLPHQVL